MADLVGRKVDVIVTIEHARRRDGQGRDRYNPNCRRGNG